MCKKSLRLAQREMAETFVDEAAEKAKFLVNREWRGPGDVDNAMRRVEQRYGVSYAALWALRYRRPKDILMSVYTRITEAYNAELDRQRRLLDHEFAASKAGINPNLARAADFVGRPEDEGTLE